MDDSALAGFPRPGRALRAVLVAIAAAGIGNAALFWLPGGDVVFRHLAVDPAALARGEWWRLYTLLTSGILTLPRTSAGIWHLAFTLIGLYFLSTDLERRWGAARFVRFLFASVAAGSLLVLLLDRITPPGATMFHPPAVLFGATAAITGTAVAWGRESPNVTMRLFFFLPMSGRWLTWITIAFCALYLLYNADVPEGTAAPFGGVVAGLLLAGSPSPIRRLYLEGKLWVLRRRGATHGAALLGPAKPKRRGGPPLRVVMGGADDAKPPKDPRQLN